VLQFVCDWCKRVKPPGNQDWIVGVAAENVAPTAARREVVVHTHWNRDEAVGPFAVHFCCEQCKDNYIAAMFDKPAVTVKPRRAKRALPAAEVVERRIVRKRKMA